MVANKVCCRCRNESPATAEFFKRNSRAKDGLWHYCKPCEAKRIADWRAANPEKVRAQKRDWAKKNPASVKAARLKVWAQHGERILQERKDRYAADPQFAQRSKASAKASWERHKQIYSHRLWEYSQREDVKVRNRQRVREWQQQNPDAVNANVQTRRARERGAVGVYSSADIASLLSGQCACCCYCDGDISGGKHTVEHLQPLSRGGSNWPSNLALACSSCNACKGAKTVQEFLEFLALRRKVNQPGVENHG